MSPAQAGDRRPPHRASHARGRRFETRRVHVLECPAPGAFSSGFRRPKCPAADDRRRLSASKCLLASVCEGRDPSLRVCPARRSRRLPLRRNTRLILQPGPDGPSLKRPRKRGSSTHPPQRRMPRRPIDPAAAMSAWIELISVAQDGRPRGRGISPVSSRRAASSVVTLATARPSSRATWTSTTPRCSNSALAFVPPVKPSSGLLLGDLVPGLPERVAARLTWLSERRV